MNRGWLCLFSFSLAFSDERRKAKIFSLDFDSNLFLHRFFFVVAGSGYLARIISFFSFTLFFPSHLVKSNYIGIFFRPRPDPFFFL